MNSQSLNLIDDLSFFFFKRHCHWLYSDWAWFWFVRRWKHIQNSQSLKITGIDDKIAILCGFSLILLSIDKYICGRCCCFWFFFFVCDVHWFHMSRVSYFAYIWFGLRWNIYIDWFIRLRLPNRCRYISAQWWKSKSRVTQYYVVVKLNFVRLTFRHIYFVAEIIFVLVYAISYRDTRAPFHPV